MLILWCVKVEETAINLAAQLDEMLEPFEEISIHNSENFIGKTTDQAAATKNACE